jgi:hypothetical protein
MALSTTQSNNKLVKFTQEINREFVRENTFSPYMGEAVNSIIRLRMELKNGGEQMNIPITGAFTGSRDRFRYAGRQRRTDRPVRHARLARLGPQRRRHQQGGKAARLGRYLRPGQAASVGLDQGTSARRDYLGPDGAAV